jgi:hypothetical protein
MHDFVPFDGLERFRKKLAALEPVVEPLPAAEPVEHIVVSPRSGLFNIYKRTTNLSENKCVGIGFTYKEAQEFIEKRLKIKVDHEERCVTFYEIISQENKEAVDPLWNPKEILCKDMDIRELMEK